MSISNAKARAFYFKFSCVLFIILSSVSCVNETDIIYDDTMQVSESDTSNLEAVNATTYPAGAVKASSFGFNSTNATAAFQKAIKSSNSVIIIDKKSANWNISPSRFTNLSNKTIIFEDGVIVKALSGKFPYANDRLIEFIDGNNIRLEGNAILEMNRHEYSNSSGRHALSFQGCKGVTVKGLTIRKSGGDGIYITKSKNRSYSENITISNVKSLYNMRQGMSIISAQNVSVTNSKFANTQGSLPEAGVDLEPNNRTDRLVNINFQNCRFTNNYHSGILLSLGNLESTSLPVSITFKNCYLSRNGTLKNPYVDTEIAIYGHKTNPVRGEVLFEDILVENSDWGLFHASKLEKAFHVTFRNVTAKKIVLKNSMPAMKIRVQDKTVSDPIGGLTFDNVNLEYEGTQPYFAAQGSSAMSGLKNVKGTVTVKSSTNKTIKYTDYNSSKNVGVNIIYKWLRI